MGYDTADQLAGTGELSSRQFGDGSIVSVAGISPQDSLVAIGCGITPSTDFLASGSRDGT